MIGGGKVAVDAVADLIAFRADRDGLAHRQRAVLGDGDLAAEILDLFHRPGRRRQQDGERGQARGKKEPHCRDGQARQENETFGTARSAAFSISKKSAGLKANQLATRFEGACWIMTLKSRTEAL